MILDQYLKDDFGAVPMGPSIRPVISKSGFQSTRDAVVSAIMGFFFACWTSIKLSRSLPLVYALQDPSSRYCLPGMVETCPSYRSGDLDASQTRRGTSDLQVKNLSQQRCKGAGGDTAGDCSNMLTIGGIEMNHIDLRSNPKIPQPLDHLLACRG